MAGMIIIGAILTVLAFICIMNVITQHGRKQ